MGSPQQRLQSAQPFAASIRFSLSLAGAYCRSMSTTSISARLLSNGTCVDRFGDHVKIESLPNRVGADLPNSERLILVDHIGLKACLFARRLVTAFLSE